MKIIGHRGARGLAPENTLASFAKALEYGVDEIELDVRTTKDHTVIVHHDRRVSDHTGAMLNISKHNYAELLAHKPDLVTFDEAMRSINRIVPVIVDIKPGAAAKPLVKAIDQLMADGWKADDMSFQSLNHPLLLALHKTYPNIPKIIVERWSSIRAVRRAKQVSTNRLNMRSWWLWAPVIKGLSSRNYALITYTVNDPAKIKRWEKYGLYGVVTDCPDRFSGR
ncbi:MAG: glycerophosphodiester phosphodiesterase [Candidatus Saccharibacteria bacterium]|nr:glycerophosphodiester phosphodiesterase [Candidatus Saccharibacteria bacterium]